MNAQQLIAEVFDHLRGMWRYRWHYVLIAWVLTMGSWLLIFKMPDVFEATAKVSVDANSLLPQLTEGLTASENIANEVDLVSKALLTRPNLEEVARQTNLALRADSPQKMEGLITGLQNQVSIYGGQDKIFTISYQDPERSMAIDVVAALLDTFVESSLVAQGDDADMTERAIRLEIDNHESRLLSAESELAEFKKTNIGYMPNSGSDYYSRLQTALADVTETERKQRQLAQKRVEIVRQLEGEEPVFGLMPSNPVQAAAGCTKAGSITQLQSELSSLQVEFTDKHPRIVMLSDTIQALQNECIREREAMGGAVAVVNPETNSLDANPVYQNLRLQLSEINVGLAALSEEHSTRTRLVAQLRADVDKIGIVETELKKLNRDYGVVESRHQELLRRWETLQSKKRLDPVTDKVQFNVLEPPFSMAAPVAPNRPLMLIAALLFSVASGVTVAFILNQIKPVFFSRVTLARKSGFPVLGNISMVMGPTEIATRKKITALWAGMNFALLVTAGVAVMLASPISAMIRDVLGSGY